VAITMPPVVFVLAGLALAGVAVSMLVWVLAPAGNRSRQRLANLGGAGGVAVDSSPQAAGVRRDAVPVLTQALQNTPLWQNLQIELIRADWLLRPSEFVALCAGAAAGVMGLAWLIFHSLGMGLALGVCVAALPYSLLKSQQQKRLKMLSLQLPDGLDMLAGSLRSGFSILRAMQVVRSQMHPPIAQEFGRVVDEVQFGIPIEAALDNMVTRTGSYDLELIVAAVQTQLAVGGNLAEIFDSISEMIRERVRLMGELSSATAEGRMSAGILLAMPIGMGLIVNMMNPGYLSPLFHDPMGLILLGAGGGLMLVGSLIIRALINVDI
jgi:tight adherence protein B